MPPNEGHLERETIASVAFDELLAGPINLSNPRIPFVIEEYNPEWISIDVRVIDQSGILQQSPEGDLVQLTGQIAHECVPEPSAALLLGLAAGGLVIRRRRRS